MRTITKRMALSALRKAVKEKGEDHSVNVCTYLYGDVVSNPPNCIVGVALINHLEIPREAFAERPGGFYAINGTFHNVVSGISSKAGVRFTPSAIKVLRAAQKRQDTQKSNLEFTPWGEALSEATKVKG